MCIFHILIKLLLFYVFIWDQVFGIGDILPTCLTKKMMDDIVMKGLTYCCSFQKILLSLVVFFMISKLVE